MAALLPVTGVMAVGVLTLTPASGPVGTLVYAGGTGFAITTSITVISNTLLLQGAATTNASGVLPSTLLGAVPAVPRGPYVLTASDGATAIFTVVPQILLATTIGFVGDTVTINGNGFTANSAVNIFWDGGSTPIATGYVTSTGVLVASATGSPPTSMTFTVPDGIRGQHSVIAQDASLQTTSALFTVNSKLIVAPTSGGVGDIISITGTGFANGQVQISFDTSQNTSPITTTNGRFATTFQVPPSSRGSHVILAQDNSGSASANFSLGQKITLNPTTAGVGDTIAISGNGFAPNSPITYKLDGSTLAISSPAVQSQANGNLPDVAFTVPAVAAGTHTVTVSDGAQNTATATFSLLAKVAITPATGTVGTQIAITGSGFTPNLPVSISWDGAALTPVVNTTSSATGTINVTITAPASARGTHVIKASDTSSVAASASFGISSKIALTPTSGGYGDTVTITFSGFAANSPISGVKIISGSTSYDLTTVPAAVQTDAAGSATLKFTIPSTPNGTWVIQGIDAGGSAQANLAVTQKIVLNPTTGSAGDTVGLVGTGFKAGTGIDLKYAGATITVAAGITTDANGSFQTQFVIPKTVAGVMPVIAGDGTNSATASFTATAKATVSTVTNQTTPGFVGQDMTVTGTGFAPNGVLTVTFESAPVTVAIVNADSAGSFTATFKVPTAPSGPHTIHVSDGTTTKDFSFFMDSTPPAAPKLVLPADKFKPKQPVPFTWGAVTDPSGVTYTLQISQDPSFATVPLEKTGLTTAQYLMTTAEKLKSAGSKTPYYWRVKATDLAGNVSPWSTANTFTIGFMWPSWIIYVWSGVAIIVALLLGLWIGRRMAFQSY